MDLKGSLVDVNLKIYPNNELVEFLKTIPTSYDLPHNILHLVKNNSDDDFKSYKLEAIKPVQLTSADIEILKQIRETFVESKDDFGDKPLNSDIENKLESNEKKHSSDEKLDKKAETVKSKIKEKFKTGCDITDINECDEKPIKKNLDKDNNNKPDKQPFLVTSDIDWLYEHIKTRRGKGENNIPYLHTLLEGASIEVPENETIKRNPILEARCVKLRAQQETREYRKMTKSVDNVRMRFPEDSISYQLKQLNRQLIAIGQFIISIFAGFLFGFRGVEWMVGNLDFGFRLLLGVMCALIIALAEIYFLAKKLNEELVIPETVQLGGPVKLADENSYVYRDNDTMKKEHQD